MKVRFHFFSNYLSRGLTHDRQQVDEQDPFSFGQHRSWALAEIMIDSGQREGMEFALFAVEILRRDRINPAALHENLMDER